MKKLNILILLLAIIFCKNQNNSIYELTPESIHLGSKIYASGEWNCKNCHGVDLKGNGPDSKDLNVKVPDLTQKVNPEKTPLDYFKVISVGTEKTIKNGINYHEYYALTDKAKWALANYLYSMQKKLENEKEKEIRKEALNKSYQEVHEFYQKNRKWYLGKNTPSNQRAKSPSLNELIQNTNYKLEQEVSTTTLSEERINKVFKAREKYQDGYEIYKNNCQFCHGIGGEGVQGSYSLGVLEDSRYEPIKNIARRKSAFIGISDLKDKNVTQQSIINKHNYYFNDEQWSELLNYINAIME